MSWEDTVAQQQQQPIPPPRSHSSSISMPEPPQLQQNQRPQRSSSRRVVTRTRRSPSRSGPHGSTKVEDLLADLDAMIGGLATDDDDDLDNSRTAPHIQRDSKFDDQDSPRPSRLDSHHQRTRQLSGDQTPPMSGPPPTGPLPRTPPLQQQQLLNGGALADELSSEGNGPSIGEILVMNPSAISGHLHKLSLSRTHGHTKWKRRFFILHDSHVLLFRSDAPTERSISSLQLNASSDAMVSEDKDNGKYILEIRTEKESDNASSSSPVTITPPPSPEHKQQQPARVWRLQGDDEDTVMLWLITVQDTIEAHLSSSQQNASRREEVRQQRMRSRIYLQNKLNGTEIPPLNAMQQTSSQHQPRNHFVHSTSNVVMQGSSWGPEPSAHFVGNIDSYIASARSHIPQSQSHRVSPTHHHMQQMQQQQQQTFVHNTFVHNTKPSPMSPLSPTASTMSPTASLSSTPPPSSFRDIVGGPRRPSTRSDGSGGGGGKEITGRSSTSFESGGPSSNGVGVGAGLFGGGKIEEEKRKKKDKGLELLGMNDLMLGGGAPTARKSGRR